MYLLSIHYNLLLHINIRFTLMRKVTFKAVWRLCWKSTHARGVPFT